MDSASGGRLRRWASPMLQRNTASSTRLVMKYVMAEEEHIKSIMQHGVGNEAVFIQCASVINFYIH